MLMHLQLQSPAESPGLAVTRETTKSSNHVQSISEFLQLVPLPARAEHDAVELLPVA